MAGLAEMVLLVGVAGLVFHLWAIIDVVRTPASVWARSDQNQILWALLVLFLSLVGPLLYLAIARPQLRAARDENN